MKTRSLLLLLVSLASASAQDADLQKKLEYGFTAFDRDKDSALNAAEFRALGEASPKLKGKAQVVDYLFHTLDANGDGKLSHDEYMNIVAVSGGAKPAVTDVSASAEQIAFFENKIRPVLAERCYKCHAEDAEKIKGGFVLDTREGIRRGGDSGPGVVPGDLVKSLVIESLHYTNKDMQMPPEKNGGKLPDSVIADFERWVRMGAPDPREAKAGVVKSEWDTERAKNHWAYQPVKQPPVPAVKNSDWPKNDIDRFVLAGLEAKGIQPVGDAKFETLVRRVYFDLTGLPPTPERLDSVLNEPGAKTFEKVVDALLQSPRFGERWGRHWLDVARYAESTGKDVNCLFPHAWRYRDYVIESFNQDKPFNEFIREQIAGDLVQAKDSRDRAMKQIATGFLAIGSRSLNERSPKQFALDTADEQIDAMSQAVLGLTVACARCHDHKFDPIPQRDYYGLAGIFLSTETLYGTAPNFQSTHATPLIELPTDCGLPRMPLRLTPEHRAEVEKDLTKTERYGAFQFYTTVAKGLFTGKGFNVNNDPQKLVLFVGINAKIGECKTELASYDSEGRQKLLAMGVRDYPSTPASAPTAKPKSIEETFQMYSGRPAQFRSISDSPLFARGDVDKPGARVPRGFVSAIASPAPAIPAKESGRRELADWLVAESNPLTARVFANRVWHWLFGQGIVPTVDNFGAMGQPPSNAALLDHLALRLQSGGWSMKALIKEILMSHAYQLAATHDPRNFEADPGNALVWRMTPRRLDAECIRDAMLAVGGGMNIEPPVGSAVAEIGDGMIGGYPIKSLRAPLSDEPFLTAKSDVRSIYLPVPRNAVPDALTVFDFAEPGAVNGSREVTTVPSQALYLLNSDFVARQAKRFADKLRALSQDLRADAAFRLAFARKPTAGETQAMQHFFADYPVGGNDVLTSFCRALLGSAEFRSID
ncbi:MAG: Protein of unknown function (DUF1553)/Protein of unknown function (DUF1549)/Planctomycete [Prosthecobacter sp.]|nr:Protein of unknown function (DUF1553)/Protein of unknown function (DUF1549)/Planctomycete [Prosthecobacter sp.]